MANKIYTAPETAITFVDSGGDVVLSLNNLEHGTGRVSARYDKGAGSKASLWRVILVAQFEGTSVVNETVECYIAESDGTNAQGNVGTSDAAIASSAVVLPNLGPPVAIAVSEVVTAHTKYVAIGTAFIPDRYFSVVVFNRSAAAHLETTTGQTCKVIMIPIPDEIQ